MNFYLAWIADETQNWLTNADDESKRRTDCASTGSRDEVVTAVCMTSQFDMCMTTRFPVEVQKSGDFVLNGLRRETRKRDERMRQTLVTSHEQESEIRAKGRLLAFEQFFILSRTTVILLDWSLFASKSITSYAFAFKQFRPSTLS